MKHLELVIMLPLVIIGLLLLMVTDLVRVVERANGQIHKATTGLSLYEDGRDNSRFELTEQEIKDYDERFWAFAVLKGERQ